MLVARADRFEFNFANEKPALPLPSLKFRYSLSLLQQTKEIAQCLPMAQAAGGSGKPKNRSDCVSDMIVFGTNLAATPQTILGVERTGAVCGASYWIGEPEFRRDI
jgi:hypothetical protein